MGGKTLSREGRKKPAFLYILFKKSPQETEKLGVEKEPPLKHKNKGGNS